MMEASEITEGSSKDSAFHPCLNMTA